jgi:dynein heavy chain
LDYNEKNRNKLNLVFFRQAIDHLLRLVRILKMKRGNALLVGVGGLGKSSLAKICTFLVGY